MRTSCKLVLLVLLVAPHAGCAFLASLFNRPTVSLRRVDLTQISFSGIGATFVLAVHNPNGIGLDLERLTYQLTVDQHPFAEGRGDHALHVPPSGDGEINLPVAIRFLDFARSLEALFTRQTVPYSIRTELGFGTPLGVIEVPLQHAGTFPVPQLPAIQIGNASLGHVRESGAGLDIVLELRNRNAFALPLGALSYRVAINGTSMASGAVSPGTLAASATQPVHLTLGLDFLRAGLGLLGAVQSGGANLALDGELNLGGYAMPIHLARTL